MFPEDASLPNETVVREFLRGPHGRPLLRWLRGQRPELSPSPKLAAGWEQCCEKLETLAFPPAEPTAQPSFPDVTSDLSS